MMDFPNIPKTSITNIPQDYNTFSKNLTTSKIKKRKVTGKVESFNKLRVIIVAIYILVIVAAAMIKINAVISVEKKGRERTEAERKLKNLKMEVESLENETITKNDFAQKKEEARKQGFVEKNSTKYIRLGK